MVIERPTDRLEDREDGEQVTLVLRTDRISLIHVGVVRCSKVGRTAGINSITMVASIGIFPPRPVPTKKVRAHIAAHDDVAPMRIPRGRSGWNDILPWK